MYPVAMLVSPAKIVENQYPTLTSTKPAGKNENSLDGEDPFRAGKN
jgi:hypothetical protein